MDIFELMSRPNDDSKAASAPYPLSSEVDDDNKARKDVTKFRQIHGDHYLGADTKVSSCLESMLKTVLETGDIGIFSIKATQLPKSSTMPLEILSLPRDNASYKIKRELSPYELSCINDRWLLSSCDRDTASEVITINKSPSQIFSSHPLDQNGCRRSYSMTQASDPAYMLLKHHNHTSLRNQSEEKGSFQRPLSPFAYPTRLKRLGFRPSSPALTDNGIVDYSQRREIDHISYETFYRTTSPLSFYSERRRPPVALRVDDNQPCLSHKRQYLPRSYPSLSSIHQKNGNWSDERFRRRISPESMSTPYFSSDLDLRSMVSLQENISAQHEKLSADYYTHSPQFYDYTEDFEDSGMFNLGSSTLQPQSCLNCCSDNHENSKDKFSRQAGNLHGCILEPSKLIACLDNSFESLALNEHESSSLLPEKTKGVAATDTYRTISTDRKANRLSTFDDYVTRESVVELETNKEDKFENGVSGPFELSSDSNKSEMNKISTTTNGTEDNLMTKQISPDPENRYVNMKEKISSTINNDSTLPKNDTPHRNNYIEQALSDFQISYEPRKRKRESLEMPGNSKDEKIEYIKSNALSSFILPIKFGESGLDSINANYKKIRECLSRKSEDVPAINYLDFKGGSSSVKYDDMLKDPLMVPGNSFIFELSSHDTHDINQSGCSKLTRAPQHERTERDPNDTYSRVESASVYDHNFNEIPNPSCKSSSGPLSRFSSPVLAPKPISLVNQLRLKNSVPQLMKTLPPLPSRPLTSNTMLSSIQKASEINSQRLLCPNFTDNGINSSGRVSGGKPLASELPHLSTLFRPGAELDTVMKNKLNFQVRDVNPLLTQSSPRIKLGMKKSNVPKKESRSNSLKHNAEKSPKVIPFYEASSKKPRITRNVNFTQEPTYKRNMARIPSRKLVQHELRQKKVIQPHCRLNSIVRKAYQKIHPKSSNSDFASCQSSRQKMVKPLISKKLTEDTSKPSSLPGILEGRSGFSDDSSNIQGRGSLKKRILDFKYRIAPLFVTRTRSRRYGGASWKTCKFSELGKPSPFKFASCFSSKKTQNRSADDLTKNNRSQRVKGKLRKWIDETKSAIYPRIKLQTGYQDV